MNNREESRPEENLYDNIQDAYNKARGGFDTLLIEGSITGYGNLTLEKPLTIIGPGYFLNENEGESATSQAASLGVINISEGANGTKLIGISIDISGGYIYVSADDVEFSRCFFGSGTYNLIYPRVSPIKNLNINRCYFSQVALDWRYVNEAPIDIYFASNIVQGGFALPEGTSGSVINNIFVGDAFNVGTVSSLQIHNNVLLSTNEEDISIPSLSSNISHNISSLKTFGTNNGNQEDILASQIFLQQGSTDGKWQIKADGPAAGAGRNGVDIGAFGGPEPYRLSGVPSIPRITDLSTDGFVNEEGKLEITIQVTAN